MLGHWHEECGSGEHEVSKLEWGDFILVDGGRGRGRGRGTGRNTGRGRGYMGRGDGSFGPGRGRGDVNPATERSNLTSWRHNAIFHRENANRMETENGEETESMNEDARNVLGKRVTVDSAVAASANSNALAVVPVVAGKTPGVTELVGCIEDGFVGADTVPIGTPQKNANRKKYKGQDGEAVETSDNSKRLDLSASSCEEDRRAQ